MQRPVLTNNTLRVKESNSNLILDTLKKFGTATRTEIARDTGLSIATCGNILKDLLKTGEILEGDLENCSSGRPARQYIYNKNFSLVIAMTIQSDQNLKTLQYAVTNLYGETVEEKIKAYDTIDPDTIVTLVDELIQLHPNIKAMGIGIPGYADKDGTIGITDVAELNGVNLAELLEKKFDIKVAIDRSPAISAYGFCQKYPDAAEDALATILMPSQHPMGVGIVINGQIYKGATNLEGEISYIYDGFAKEFAPQQKGESSLVQESLFSVAAIIATINPSLIVFMGRSFTEETYEKIVEKSRAMFPENFLPKFQLYSDYSDVYLEGTIQIAIDCLKSKVKLVAR